MSPSPFVLDPTGGDLHSEAALLRARGSVTPVELPGGVTAWSIGRIDLVRRLLADPRVSKDPGRHWRAWRNGDIPDDWPLNPWVAGDDMFNAYGAEHRRLRSFASRAFTARRVAALRPRVDRIVADPVANLPLRYAVEDITVDGVDIRRGDAILVNYAAAGRDPAHHGATADEYDLTLPVALTPRRLWPAASGPMVG